MGLFSSSSSDDYDKAQEALTNAYNEAAGYMSPYTSNAGTDFGNARNYLYGAFGQMQQYGNPWGQFYDYANMSPIDLYNSLVQSYTMSPQEMNEIKMGQSAANNMATTNGMYGSGENYALNAEIARQGYDQGLNQYLQSIGDVVNKQTGFAKQFSNQMSGLTKMFGNLLGTEYDASSSMANIGRSLGQASANLYGREAQSGNQWARMAGGIAGGLTSGLMNYMFKDDNKG